MKRTFKIYGFYGHRIKESFNESHTLDVSKYRDYPCIINVLNSDKTGTNDYCLVEIESDDLDNIYKELEGQLSDGIFENQHTGYYCQVLSPEEERELAYNLDWGDPTQDPDDFIDSLINNWDIPLDRESAENVYKIMVDIWKEKQE